MVPDRDYWKQFAIVLSDEGAPEVNLQLTPETTTNASDGLITVSTGDFLNYEFEWTDLNYNVISTSPVLDRISYWFPVTDYDYESFSGGNTFLKLTNAEGCQFYYDFWVWRELICATIGLSPSVKTENCGLDNGSIYPSVSEGVVEFLWSNGSTEEKLEGVGEGEYTLIASDENGCSVTKKFYIPSDCLFSGLEEVSTELHVYPNPAEDFIYVDLENFTCSQYVLFDLAGQKMLENNIENQSTIEIDLTGLTGLNDLNSGVYFLKMQTSSGVLGRRILLK